MYKFQDYIVSILMTMPYEAMDRELVAEELADLFLDNIDISDGTEVYKDVKKAMLVLVDEYYDEAVAEVDRINEDSREYMKEVEDAMKGEY